uniref:arginine--tRNA ligase n=1 Tax=Ningiella ruwaisensis TaxID=2364274 RepID=UPI0010A0AA16|nr:arginine--tRNA ligase [Ningiella ruwaisensis]
MLIQAILVDRFKQAIEKLILAHNEAGANIDAKTLPVPLSKSTRPEFGEYQFNGAMALSKQLKKNPREIAQEILEHVSLDDIAHHCEIAGPGFINIHLDSNWIAQQIEAANGNARLNVSKQTKQKVVVDYSSPNLAKEMHVGHLRSTIIGDAVVKVLEFLGADVIRQNHMGDWGTQFGMLLAHLSDKLEQSQASTALSDLEDFYREAKVRFDNEEGFADRAREYVVKLQSGDEQCLALWEQFIDISISHSEEVYTKLGVSLSREDIMGESAYNPDLPVLVKDLLEREVAVRDQGAVVVFLPELADKNGNPAVYIIQKSGGGYLYATTDLAAIRYRCGKLSADRTMIFTDARQALHFKQTELVARKANYMPASHHYQHCPFGMMLGKDGKPFKTRSGTTIKLADLLDEAIERAAKLIAQRAGDKSDDELQEIAQTVGIGAVKYADLSKNRTTDYIFDWDSMLSFEGNTAPYLQYAYTRIRSIFRKADIEMDNFTAPVTVANHSDNESERALAIKLLQFEDALLAVSNEAAPHLLCTYLYELASLFMKFYEASPILKTDVDASLRDSRLGLAALSAKTLKQGLSMLGIDVLEQM